MVDARSREYVHDPEFVRQINRRATEKGHAPLLMQVRDWFEDRRLLRLNTRTWLGRPFLPQGWRLIPKRGLVGCIGVLLVLVGILFWPEKNLVGGYHALAATGGGLLISLLVEYVIFRRALHAYRARRGCYPGHTESIVRNIMEPGARKYAQQFADNVFALRAQEAKLNAPLDENVRRSREEESAETLNRLALDCVTNSRHLQHAEKEFREVIDVMTNPNLLFRHAFPSEVSHSFWRPQQVPVPPTPSPVSAPPAETSDNLPL